MGPLPWASCRARATVPPVREVVPPFKLPYTTSVPVLWAKLLAMAMVRVRTSLVTAALSTGELVRPPRMKAFTTVRLGTQTVQSAALNQLLPSPGATPE